MSELYKLPAGWEWESISTIVDKNFFTDGNWVLAKDYDFPKEVRLLQLADIGESTFVDKSDKWVSEKKSIELKGKYLNKGDVLISRLGEPLAKSCLVPSTSYKTMTSVDVAILRKDENLFHNRFIMLYFNSSYAKDFIEEQATGSTRKRISRKNLSNIPIPLPPLAEQKRIVAKLDSLFEKIDKAIELHQQNITKAKTLMASALDKTFKKLEGEYSYKKLKDITIKIGSGATPKGGQKAYKQEGISLIRSMNVHDIGFTKKGLAFIDDSQADKLKNVIVEKGDILLNITGASVARCCVVCESVLPARVNQHVSIIRLDDSFISKFVHYYLISPMKKTELLFSSSGGATREAITKSMIENFQVPDISLPIQQQTVEYLESIAIKVDKIKQLNEQKLENLKALKASILDKAFRGEL